jgi:5'-3' exonuclease
LNRFLIENCSKKSIKKTHLNQLSNHTFVIDTSIYLYKFMALNALLENMYLFISILKKYNITPIFIFDGKPPPEKNALLEQRKMEKKDAQQRYNETEKKLVMSGLSAESRNKLLSELDILKRQIIRIREEDVMNVKKLLDAYGVTYYTSYTEADQLCSYLVKSGQAWACVSDDMDMFLYGCNRVLRHISLLNHTVVYYDFETILKDLKMSETNFREIMVLSGTDYNMNTNANLYNTIQYYESYSKDRFCKNQNQDQGFYEWLLENTTYIQNEDLLTNTYNMFLLEKYQFDSNFIITNNNNNNKINYTELQTILKKEGFLFPPISIRK